MNLSMEKVRNAAYFSFLFVVVFALLSESAWAEASKKESNAPTSPPPTEFQIQGFFDPDFLYLDAGHVSLKDNGNQTFTIHVVTEAKQDVSAIGATVYLQKWTGTEWINRSVKTVSTTNDWIFSGDLTANVESGYYYRVRVIHYVNHNGTYESGETVSGHLLAD
ncbi:hypothetical protein [Marinicrinis lubricantis]|uniref:Uncharacterized protein n=1 Tax=Marinicrinis lubricantis TaxID=2086470 RepID=A0ABW1IR01_9BACL